ncbi:MAG: ATPase [Clostridia bacterium]|nr:ATPase [Clostridia bacterium]
MIVYERLASIEKILEEARKLPLSSKVMIDADEMSLLLKEIKVSLPEELKQARWISEERKKIISEAHVEADDIITEAQDKIDEHELVRLAKEKAESIIKEAEAEASETREKANETAEAIRKATLDYTDSVLEKVQRNLDGFIDTIIENRRELE